MPDWSKRSTPTHQEDALWTPYHYFFSLVPNTPTTILPARDNRKYLLIQNLSDTDVSVCFDGTPATNGRHPVVPANGGNYELSRVGTGVPLREVSAVHVGVGNKVLVVLEGRSP